MENSEVLAYRKKVEESIQKKFHPSLMSPFTKALKEYEMLKDGDRVAVCISGGKDSMLMAMLFRELLRYSKVKFEAEYLMMDPGYNEANRQKIIENSELLGVPIKIFDAHIFNSVKNVDKNPCYLCARMRRGYLYTFARELGCNKIALGHHYDDVIETLLMGILHSGQIQGMMPKLHSTNYGGMELIRPLYLIREEDIIAWRDYNGLSFLRCACRFTEELENEDGTSKRQETKELIRSLKKTSNPDVDKCIFRAMGNVHLDTMIGYKTGGERHSFLESYNKADNE